MSGGAAVGHYELLGELGRGAQGRMFLARDSRSGEQVALKEVDFGRVDAWKAIELFDREAEILRSLDHPSVPAYIDSFHLEDDGALRFYLAQAYIAGQPLDRHLEQGARLDEAGARELLDAMLDVLAYFEELNPPVVHRDIKPANIIRRDSGGYALVDFGAVQTVLPELVGGSTIVGTTGYMPPEQLMGRATPASDIYALGATVVAAMSGVDPTAIDTVRMKLDFRSHVVASPALLELLDRMLEPAVERRLQTAHEVREALEGRLILAPGAADGAAAGWGAIERRIAQLVEAHPTYASSIDATPQRLRIDVGPWKAPPVNFVIAGVVLGAAILLSVLLGGCPLHPLVLLAGWLIYAGRGHLRPVSEHLMLDRSQLQLERHEHKLGDGVRIAASTRLATEKLYLPHVHRLQSPLGARQRLELVAAAKRHPGIDQPGLIFGDHTGARASFGETIYTRRRVLRRVRLDDRGELDLLDEIVTLYLKYLRGNDDA